MTGIAQLVAQEIELRLDGEGLRIATLLMDELDAGVCRRRTVPDLHIDLWPGRCAGQCQAALRVAAERAAGSGQCQLRRHRARRCTYAETFCNGGKRFDRILSELGARRIGEIMLHDASAGTMPEEVAAEWVRGWMEKVRETYSMV